MRVWIHIRVDAQCDWCANFFRASDTLDRFQLSFTLDVEAIDALLQGVLDFAVGLPYTCERAPGRIASRREHTKQLTTGNNIEASPGAGEQVQDSAIRVRFYCITNKVIQRRERGAESRVVVENCRLA